MDFDERTEPEKQEYTRSSDESIAPFVARVVAAHTNRSVTELEPLGRVIDVDALAALFDSRHSNDDERWVKVSFGYEGLRVVIQADGAVKVLVEPEEED